MFERKKKQRAVKIGVSSMNEFRLSVHTHITLTRGMRFSFRHQKPMVLPNPTLVAFLSHGNHENVGAVCLADGTRHLVILDTT